MVLVSFTSVDAVVRIPLADLGVTQTEHIIRVRIGRYRWWLETSQRPITRQILIDHVQFVEVRVTPDFSPEYFVFEPLRQLAEENPIKKATR